MAPFTPWTGDDNVARMERKMSADLRALFFPLYATADLGYIFGKAVKGSLPDIILLIMGILAMMLGQWLGTQVVSLTIPLVSGSLAILAHCFFMVGASMLRGYRFWDFREKRKTFFIPALVVTNCVAIVVRHNITQYFDQIGMVIGLMYFVSFAIGLTGWHLRFNPKTPAEIKSQR